MVVLLGYGEAASRLKSAIGTLLRRRKRLTELSRLGMPARSDNLGHAQGADRAWTLPAAALDANVGKLGGPIARRKDGSVKIHRLLQTLFHTFSGRQS